MKILKLISIFFVAGAIASAQAAIPPNHSSISDDLLVWLTDAGANYSEGTWLDSSGRNHHVSEVFSSDGNFGGGSSLNPAVGSFGERPTRTGVDIATKGMMGVTGTNGGTGFSDVTIIALYRVSVAENGSRPYGIASKTIEHPDGLNADRFHMATDPSIRYDDGANTGGAFIHPEDELVLRASRIRDGEFVSDWFYDVSTGTLLANLDEETIGSGSQRGTAAPNFVTINDDLYLGDIGSWEVQNPTNATQSNYTIVELALYGASLSDSDIQGVADYMAIPEPRTYALLAGVLIFGIVLCRGRTRKADPNP